jgi:ribosomal protein S18 acetylase RimI-like enzyme
VRIRPASLADLEFIQQLAPRLTEFGPVPGRERREMVERDRACLAEALRGLPSPRAAIFIAEDEQGEPLGFVNLTTATDYYTNSTTAHIADLVVAPRAGGRGVGSALVERAEEWARHEGLALLTLNVFGGNEQARRLYRRLGFAEEWIRCIKRL